MCEIEFISDLPYDFGYGTPLEGLFCPPKYRMVYDTESRKFMIRNLVGKSAFEVYQLLCHEVLHATLHRVEGLSVCEKLDNISNVVDGEYAYIWMGEDWKQMEI